MKILSVKIVTNRSALPFDLETTSVSHRKLTLMGSTLHVSMRDVVSCFYIKLKNNILSYEDLYGVFAKNLKYFIILMFSGKKFARELYLTRHLIIHTGQFSCVICNKRYGRKEELIKHMLECTASVQV